jgi:serine/threonine-protein phosphatase PGAM5
VIPNGQRFRAALPMFLAIALASSSTASSAAEPARGTRTIILVRHGLYDDQDPRDPDVGKALVPVGEEQAKRAGERLAKWWLPVDALHASSMTRARQTAEIIGKAIHRTPHVTTELRECTPPTDRLEIGKDETPGERDSCRARLEAAWSRYFTPTRGADSVEVLVSHSGVIRWLVARSIGLDTKLWLNFGAHNGAFTIVEVRPDGQLRLVAYNDTGHLSNELITPAPRAAPAAAAPATPKSPR